MGKTFVCSLCRNGIIGGGLSIDEPCHPISLPTLLMCSWQHSLRELSFYGTLAAAVTLCAVRRNASAGKWRCAAREYEARRTAARTRVEHDCIYNRLKRRKNQGKISVRSSCIVYGNK